MKRLLIIGAGEMQVPIIKKAKELGHICIVTDIDANAPGFTYADVKAIVSTRDFDKTLAIACENNIDGILTTSDYPVRVVAYVCEHLGLKGLSKHAAEVCTDKFLQREVMKKSGGYIPVNFLFNSTEQIQLKKNDFIFPLIVKPTDSSASRGVNKVENYDELIIAFNEALAFSSIKKVIVEEFINGPEYSIESLTQNGKTHVIAITEKSVSGSGINRFVESRHIVPAKLPAADEKMVRDYSISTIKHLGLNNSSSHAEIKLSSKGPVLIEIGARLGGDYITSDLVPLATGIDMMANVVKLALGEDIDIVPTKAQFAGVQFINSENYRSVEALIASNNKTLLKHELKPFKQTVITNSLDRLGYIISVTKDYSDLVSFLDLKMNLNNE